MGLGAIIAFGEENELLASDLFDCITEVRVEQTLDAPIHFAIRFQEDLEDGEPRVRQTPELQAEQILTIAVETEDEIKCLVRGPITETKASTTLGGPGSWYEVRGQDRRVEMSRVCVAAGLDRARFGSRRVDPFLARLHAGDSGNDASV